jgi:hypothetical protein
MGLVLSCHHAPSAAGAPPGSGAAQAPAATPPQEGKTMRQIAVAGPPGMGFYPDDPKVLREEIDQFLDRATLPEFTGDIVAVMAPHAGYPYSGPVAAYSYKALKGKPYSTVILLGNSHGTRFEGAALSEDDEWQTPLGPVAVDRQIVDELAAQGPPFFKSRQAHLTEHSLEVQTPFLKVVLPDAKIVPILLCDVGQEKYRDIARALAPILKRPDTVLVASSDMSHYPSYEDATRCDKATLAAVTSLDPTKMRACDEGLMREGVPNLACTLCGMAAVATAVIAVKDVGVNQAVVLKYANSGDTAPETKPQRRCVGYGAVAFLAPEGVRGKTAQAGKAPPQAESALTRDEKIRLLRIARQTLQASFGQGEKPSLDPGGSAALARKTACFVTLKIGGELRGCIGELEAREPLIQAVAHRAISAAMEDPRFRPLSERELAKVTIEISAMSPLRKVASPDEVVVGKHGVVVRQSFHSGVFLPQVAPEQGWDRDTMLTVLCREKAGLPGDAWRKGAELWVFTADVFGEEEMGLR